MLIVGECLLGLFIGILIGILIEKTANCLASQHQQKEQKDNYYYDSLDNFYYSDEFVNMSQIEEENHQLLKYY